MKNQDFRIIPKKQFQPEEIAMIEKLVQRCSQEDGFEANIGLEAFSLRTGEDTTDFLCYSGDQLIGYLGYFTFDNIEAEISGLVHPNYRLQGIFQALLATAEAELHRRNIQIELLTVNAQSPSGIEFAQRAGAAFRNAEFSMSLAKFNPKSDHIPGFKLRPATPEDFEFLVTCSSKAFGDPEDFARTLLTNTNEPNRTSYVALLNQTPVGMIRVLTIGVDRADIHGFSVLPEFQGKGLGRQILSDTVAQVLDQGRTNVILDVVTDNSNALRLYQLCGFEVTAEHRYYEKHLTK